MTHGYTNIITWNRSNCLEDRQAASMEIEIYKRLAIALNDKKKRTLVENKPNVLSNTSN